MPPFWCLAKSPSSLSRQTLNAWLTLKITSPTNTFRAQIHLQATQTQTATTWPCMQAWALQACWNLHTHTRTNNGSFQIKHQNNRRLSCTPPKHLGLNGNPNPASLRGKLPAEQSDKQADRAAGRKMDRWAEGWKVRSAHIYMSADKHTRGWVARLTALTKTWSLFFLGWRWRHWKSGDENAQAQRGMHADMNNTCTHTHTRWKSEKHMLVLSSIYLVGRQC